MEKVKSIKKLSKCFTQLENQELMNTSGGAIISPAYFVAQWVLKKFK